MESDNRCCKMNGTWRFVLLLLIMIIYVLVGAAIFQAIEQKVETEEKKDLTHLKQYITRRILSANVTLEDMDKFIAEIVEASKMGVFADHNLTSVEETSWSYTESLFFVATLLTTVGYGHITAVAAPGKIFSIFYIILGLPLTLITFSLIVSRLMKPSGMFLSFLKSKMPGVRRDLYIELLHLAIISIAMFIMLFLLPSILFTYMEEDWGYFDSIYFCFISLFTIGLGDMVPAMSYTADREGLSAYQLFVTLWLYVGLISMMTLIAIICNIKELDVSKYFLMDSNTEQSSEMTILTNDMDADEQSSASTGKLN